MTPPTRAAIQARADALEDDYLYGMRLALGYHGKRLDAALHAVANGCPRSSLCDKEAAALRASPYRYIREAGARRLIARQLLERGK